MSDAPYDQDREPAAPAHHVRNRLDGYCVRCDAVVNVDQGVIPIPFGRTSMVPLHCRCCFDEFDANLEDGRA